MFFSGSLGLSSSRSPVYYIYVFNCIIDFAITLILQDQYQWDLLNSSTLKGCHNQYDGRDIASVDVASNSMIFERTPAAHIYIQKAVGPPIICMDVLPDG